MLAKLYPAIEQRCRGSVVCVERGDVLSAYTVAWNLYKMFGATLLTRLAGVLFITHENALYT